MHIAFNTDELSSLDKQVLAILSGAIILNETPTQVIPEAPADVRPDIPAAEEPAKPAPAKKAPAKAKPAPAPAPEPVVEQPVTDGSDDAEEDLLGGTETEAEADAPTMADAVAAATKLVSSQKGSVVKAALADLGVKRVSELGDDQIAAFLAALS